MRGRWPRLAHVQIAQPGHGGIESYGYPVGAAFTSAGFGILWESRGILYVTRDGGAHWTPKPKVAQPEADFGFGGAVFPGGRAFLLLARGAGPPARLLETKTTAAPGTRSFAGSDPLTRGSGVIPEHWPRRAIDSSGARRRGQQLAEP